MKNIGEKNQKCQYNFQESGFWKIHLIFPCLKWIRIIRSPGKGLVNISILIWLMKIISNESFDSFISSAELVKTNKGRLMLFKSVLPVKPYNNIYFDWRNRKWISFSFLNVIESSSILFNFWKSNESVLSLDDLRKNKLRYLSCMRCRVIYWAFFCIDSKFKLFLPSLTSPSQSFDVYLVRNSTCFEGCNRRQKCLWWYV